MEEDMNDREIVTGSESVADSSTAAGKGNGIGKRLKTFFINVARLVGTVVLGYASAFAFNVLFGTMMTSVMRFVPLFLLRSLNPARAITQSIVPEYWIYRDFSDGWFSFFFYFAITFIVGILAFLLLIYLSRYIIKIINRSKFLSVVLALFYVWAIFLFAKQLFFSDFYPESGISKGVLFYVVAIVHLCVMCSTFFMLLCAAFRGDDSF